MRFRSEALAALLLAAPAAAEGVDCAEAVTQIELTYCAEQAWLAADAELNRVWARAVEQARTLQAALPADAPVDIEGDLRAAQRVWIDFRDRACTAESHQAWGGSMMPMLVYACRERLTERRTEDLRRFAEEM
jgi:uncharacterized protein YecT (DUF1311 family)